MLHRAVRPEVLRFLRLAWAQAHLSRRMFQIYMTCRTCLKTRTASTYRVPVSRVYNVEAICQPPLKLPPKPIAPQPTYVRPKAASCGRHDTFRRNGTMSEREREGTEYRTVCARRWCTHAAFVSAGRSTLLLVDLHTKVVNGLRTPYGKLSTLTAELESRAEGWRL